MDASDEYQLRPEDLARRTEVAVGVLHPVAAFLRAFRRRHTYSPRNVYLVFGFLWGLPIPIVTMAVDAVASGRGFSLSSMAESLAIHPWHGIFMLHPVIFALIFGAMGTVQQRHTLRIQHLVRRLNLQATTDGLTGLLNHQCFHEKAAVEALRAAREGQDLTMILGDLDSFKQINDRYGHPAGDVVLKGIAEILKRGVRPYDLVCRHGGEEFAILLVDLGQEDSMRVAERIRQAVASHCFELPAGVSLNITISLGLSSYRAGENLTAWIQRTDDCLYRAKHLGKNRICRDKEMP